MEIHHIGSTSIPNIKAKPVIDIMIVVNDIEKVDQVNDKMIELGYEPKGEFGIKNRRFFQKGGNNRTHHVHVFQKGDSEVEKHINFRDYMRSHPKEAKNYSMLKDRLSDKYKYNIEKYIEGKNDFIKEIDKKAKKWKENTNENI
jgi:GrpB-like predicted nucleotidyltransferase (UPF0157 family)